MSDRPDVRAYGEMLTELAALAARVRELETALAQAVSAMKSGEPLHEAGQCKGCDGIRAALGPTRRDAP